LFINFKCYQLSEQQQTPWLINMVYSFLLYPNSIISFFFKYLSLRMDNQRARRASYREEKLDQFVQIGHQGLD
jgi:hypothetical protein